jgi:hypothetical protein
MGHARRPAILRPSHTIAVAVLCTLAAACSGTSSEPHSAAAQGVDVQVVPSTATVAPNATTRLAAAVTGTANTAVTWTVVQASGGTVDSTGLYTAPATAGSYTVRATSVADSTAHGDAAVTVTAPPPPVTVTISPRTPSVTAGGTIAFTATVANATNTAVTWSVTGTTCGTITSAGVYTAPSAAGTCSVAAKSVQDPTRSDTTTVTVTAPPPPPPAVTVSLSPSPAATNSCLTLTFTATVANATNKTVTWSVQEGAAGGTITTAGVYTAPANAGTYHVVATSVADGTKAAVSTVTVTDKILSVTTSPATVSVAPGVKQQFTATVTTTCGSFQAVASGP